MLIVSCDDQEKTEVITDQLDNLSEQEQEELIEKIEEILQEIKDLDGKA